MDRESAEWLRVLGDGTAGSEAGLARLHALLLRVARSETNRRASRHRLAGPELDDLAFQAAADAMITVLAKLSQFRGESRFTTWAYKFVVFEVAGKVARHHWLAAEEAPGDENWDLLPDRFGVDPAQRSQVTELMAAFRRAVDEHLTPHQRRVFVSLVLTGVPVDVLAATSGSSRGALYKTMFDARQNLRAALAAEGFVNDEKVAR